MSQAGEDKFVYSFPLYLLAKGFTLRTKTFHGYPAIGLNDPDGIGLPLFTDRPAAEDFRDEHARSLMVFELPSPAALLSLLADAKKEGGVTTVMVDPTRSGKRTWLTPIDQMISEHTAGS